MKIATLFSGCASKKTADAVFERRGAGMKIATLFSSGCAGKKTADTVFKRRGPA
jgi:hypothetical protein